MGVGSMLLRSSMPTISPQSDNLENVSESVGLSSATVFSRFFKTQAELSPATWRKENRFEIES